MLELRDIEKSYGALKAVKQLSLTIREGEFFSLLGPSGCGKTTLLRMLGGFEAPTSGAIYQDGRRIDTLPANQRQFNMVFQRYALFPHLNVFENIAFGLRMKRVKSAEIKSRVAEILALVKMEGYESRMIATLSGGQQQRIALARALVNRPRVLLLDEPLSALDLKLRQQMQVELLALQKKLKHTFIFVTHDQEEALTLSDRIAVMNHGVVEQVGSAQEIYEYPRTAFVAQFIGSINTLECEVLEVRTDAIALKAFSPSTNGSKKPLMVKPSRDGARPLPTSSDGVEASRAVKMLVRPEKIKILKTQPTAEQNWLEGTLKEVLYQGPVTQFLIEGKEGIREGTPPILVTQHNTALTARKSFSAGEKVFVAWAPEDCIVMNAAESGNG